MKIRPDDLKKWRVKHGLTQEDAARIAGVCRRTWQSWEAGTTKIQFSIGYLMKCYGNNKVLFN